MAGQPSFRRFLLVRLLLFSIPILLLGIGVTFRKTRATLLETAHLHLMERATRGGEGIHSELEVVKTQLAIASQSQTIQTTPAPVARAYLLSLLQQYPRLTCLQLLDLPSREVVESTCGETAIAPNPPRSWSRQQMPGASPYTLASVHSTAQHPLPQPPENSLELVVSVPVYNRQGQLVLMLSGLVTLQTEQYTNPLGYTLVIDQAGKILAHPLQKWVGRNITEMGDYNYSLILAQLQQDPAAEIQPLVNLMGDRTRWLVGYSALPMAVNDQETHTWTVLSITRLEDALNSLNSITQLLVILTLGLLLAHLLASVCTARGLARPIEQLGDYARHIQLDQSEELPLQALGVRELNQLAHVLNDMVGRLEDRATELESAWQAAEAANQLKSEFLATTSHELRTPLNAIIGCLQLVVDGYCDSSDEEKDLLRQAEKAALHLLKIINDLLDIRSIEAGSIRLFPETVNICHILSEVIALQQMEIQRKHLTLIAPNLAQPILVRADVIRLKQVILNVVANAIKFTDAGQITLEVHLETRHQAGMDPDRPSLTGTADADPDGPSPTHIVIAVRDTGIGIAPDQQQKLFRPFSMADGSTTRKFEGTGLGLAISRNLIERMGGTIMLYSEGLQMGTCVEIALPILERPMADRGQELPTACPDESVESIVISS